MADRLQRAAAEVRAGSADGRFHYPNIAIGAVLALIDLAQSARTLVVLAAMDVDAGRLHQADVPLPDLGVGFDA